MVRGSLQNGISDIRAVVFDWSGVLADEIDCVAEAHVRTIRELGGRDLAVDEWKQGVGGDWSDIYLEAGVDGSRVASAPRVFEGHFKSLLPDAVRPIAGAPAVLQELHEAGVELAVLSNQFRPCVEALIQRFGWSHYFTMVEAANDGHIPKRDVGTAWRILRRLKVDPDRVVFVDDMEEGLKLARSIGSWTVGLGSGLKRDLSAVADLVIDELIDLVPLILAGAAAEGGGRLGRAEATREYRAIYEMREIAKNEGRLARLPQIYHAENRAFVSLIRRWLAPSLDEPLLDVGCGRSAHLVELARACNFGRAVRVDVSLSALKHHDDATGGQGCPAYGRIQADVVRLPFAASTIGLVWCTELLEHVISPAETLKEIRRVLKNGGYLVVAVPNAEENTSRWFRGLQRKFNEAGHVREFSLQGLRDMLNAAGFEVVTQGHRSFLAFWLCFSVERGRLSRAAGALVRAPVFGWVLSRLASVSIRLENRMLFRRSTKGMGVFAVARAVEERPR